MTHWDELKPVVSTWSLGKSSKITTTGPEYLGVTSDRQLTDSLAGDRFAVELVRAMESARLRVIYDEKFVSVTKAKNTGGHCAIHITMSSNHLNNLFRPVEKFSLCLEHESHHLFQMFLFQVVCMNSDVHHCSLSLWNLMNILHTDVC